MGADVVILVAAGVLVSAARDGGQWANEWPVLAVAAALVGLAVGLVERRRRQ